MARTTDSSFHYAIRTETQAKPYDAYGCVSITLSSGVVDYNVLENTTLFDKLCTANELLFRVGLENDITIKLDESDHDSIPVEAGSQYGLSSVAVENIFITCSGASSMVINTFGWK